MTRTLLTGGAVFEPASGRVEQAEVLLQGDRILAVGTGLDGDTAVDCAGGLLLPGFLDCHVHLCLGASLGQPGDRPRSTRPLSAVPALRTLLAQGITTVRDAWGADAGLPLALARGWFEGPDVLVSLRQVCTTGGLGDHWSARYGPVDGFGDPGLPDPVFDGPDQARAVVRRMVRAGADWIKVTATGSLTLGRGVHDVQLTEAEMTALVDEAARQGGRGVMVHAHGARAAELAARAGARSVEHGTFLDEAAVAAMAASGTWLVPTLSTSHGGEASPHAADHRRAVRLAHAAGVPIAMGTDAPERPYAEALREIHYLAEAGLGPAGALRAATLDAARLLGLAADRGEIAPGKRADLVLLAGAELATDALADRVRAVWHHGRRVVGPATPEVARPVF
ncbi:amidohydrolase family protein [Streptomyces sp. DSM 44915]|uniref:Amidohydrolase family protein n=1 Tax=Streptomyces chisholmiae TaxID=3075540 RepID=A0ABU2JJY5_9ACTN|nr:amidohydrolase family protein [Streptomyces sp. DSM 44915]MDT0265300.1 amidohydrolase family protein [Streptomyces sp. DSM 44915]